jgi:hypothetical protein
MTKASINSTQKSLHAMIADDAYAMSFQSIRQYRAALLQQGTSAAIPPIVDPLGQHWRQPIDIRLAPMDDTHVLLTQQQFDGLSDYSHSYPSGTYDGKCWKREGEEYWYLCWYQPHATPGKIGIGSRVILPLDVATQPHMPIDGGAK